MLEYAIKALKAGLCVLPPKEGDKPPCEDWMKYKDSLPTEAKLNEWYNKKKLTGIGYVCGKTSGNLEVMDFDIEEYFEKYMDAIEGYDTELAEKFLSFVERSPRGVHVYYKAPNIGKNRRLAKVNGKVAIETRSEGGYIVAAPTVRGDKEYKQIYGDFSTIPTFTAEERDELHRIARECFDEFIDDKPIVGVRSAPKNGVQRPGDAFNAKHGISEVAQKFGWQFRRNRSDGVTEWTRPGSSSKECHATTGKTGDALYVFSSNAAPLDPDTAYDAFALYAYYVHKGDFPAAASDLSARGYGDKTNSNDSWQFKDNRQFTEITLDELLKKELPPMKWMIEGLIPEGCTILAGAPKIGKSWLALDMTLTISTPSRKLFGEFPAPHGTALYLALEDSMIRLQNRTKQIIEGLPQYHPQAAKASNKAAVNISWPPIGRGCIEQMQEFVSNNPDTRIIIVDTLAKVRPQNTSKGANAYELDYAVVSEFQKFAITNHLAVILITHLRKSNGMAKDADPFDDVTGSMAISGAADATIIFKRGKTSDIGDFYIRGRDVEGKNIKLKNVNGVWFYLGDAAEAPAHMEEIREYVADTGNRTFAPAAFNKWYRLNYGEEIKSIWVVFKRLYEAGH